MCLALGILYLTLVLIKPCKVDHSVPFYTGENGGSERLSNLPKILQTERERCGIQI